MSKMEHNIIFLEKGDYVELVKMPTSYGYYGDMFDIKVGDIFRFEGIEIINMSNVKFKKGRPLFASLSLLEGKRVGVFLCPLNCLLFESKRSPFTDNCVYGDLTWESKE